MRYSLALFSLFGVLAVSACGAPWSSGLGSTPARIMPANVRASGTVGLWATGAGGRYLLGLTANGGKLVTSIDTQSQCGEGPSTIKVDSSQNVWADCYVMQTPEQGGGMLEYAANGAFERSFLADGSFECPGSDPCYFSSLDGGWDANGHVFAELSDGTDTSNNQILIPGFVWWNSSKPSQQGTFIPAGSSACDPICTIYHMDVDAHGNIWFDYLGGPNDSTPGLGEVKTPTTHPSIALFSLPSVTVQPGGVYINDRSQVLNIVDEPAGSVYRYHLPVTSRSKPFTVLGPTLKNLNGEGTPDDGAFNKDDSKVALGDDYGWLDLGTVRGNTWKTAANVNLVNGALGAAYTPSDKISTPP